MRNSIMIFISFIGQETLNIYLNDTAKSSFGGFLLWDMLKFSHYF